jgi:putative DNA primase/helicase
VDPARQDGNDCLQAGLRLLREFAWSVLPLCNPQHLGIDRVVRGHSKGCSSPGKRPWPRWKEFQTRLPTEDELRQSWKRYPYGNVGVALGPVSGIIRADVDGMAAWEALVEKARGDLPPTVEFVSGREDGTGKGLLFKIPEGVVLRTTPEPRGKKEELRFQSEGAQTVLPPSRHVSGKRYEWVPGRAPWGHQLALAPEWLVKELAEGARQASGKKRARASPGATPPSADAGGADGGQRGGAHEGNGQADAGGGRADRVPAAVLLQRALDVVARKGNRNDAGFELCCWLRDEGYKKIEAAAVLEKFQETVEDDGDHAYTKAEALASLDSAYSWPPRERPAGALHRTDQGNAERLVKRHGDDLHYCRPLRSWLIWDKRRWCEDDTGGVDRAAVETVRSIYWEAAGCGDADEAKALAKHAYRSESAKSIHAMIDLAQSVKPVPVRHTSLDRDGYLLNLLNGTLELRTGTLREHRRHDLLTRLAPVAYDPEAECPLWLAFLDRIMGGDAGLIGYLQRAIGYSLTAATSEKCLFFLYGGGDNGKSTFLRVLLDLLGDYGLQAVSELLLARTAEAHPTERAQLVGRRLVATIETDQGRKMAEALMKQLTGSDRVSARRLYKDLFEFDPTWKIFLAANHKPQVSGTDRAVWERIKLVPFTVTIPKAEQDKHLQDKLRAQWPGILAWAVRGCLDWQRHGLGEPKAVTEATATYRREQDKLQRFVDERCVVGPQCKVKAKAFFEAFQAWSGDCTVTQMAFGSAIEDKGFPRGFMHGNVQCYKGIELRTRFD